MSFIVNHYDNSKTTHENKASAIKDAKNKLKELFPGFDEKEHGKQIVAKLRIEHVLSRRETCASLRTLFGWCSKAIGEEPTDRFELAHGSYCELTKTQIDEL